MKRVRRSRTQLLLVGILVLGVYLLAVRGRHSVRHSRAVDEAEIDLQVLESELDDAKNVVVATFQPPKEDRLAWAVEEKAPGGGGQTDPNHTERTLKFHRTWMYANKVTNSHELFADTPDVEAVLTALGEARIVHVGVLDPEEYESGTSEKWVITLEGGQRAMMKLHWGEPKGGMKKHAECNLGHEMPWAEIAAFHLHSRVMSPTTMLWRQGLQNPLLLIYDNRWRHASQRVGPWVNHLLLCPTSGSPNLDRWSKYGLNNKTYCEMVRKKLPYTNDRYYHDLFDFAVIDTLMYHYDSKHYILSDDSNANGLTVRLDHGRAFCAHDRDLEHIFLAPLKQCCILRRETYWTLKVLRPGQLSDRLRLELSRDPLAPILEEAWYPALERRLVGIIKVIDQCTAAVGGLEHMLVG